MMMTHSRPSKSALFMYLLVVVLSVVADVVAIDNSAEHETSGVFSLPSKITRRALQDKRNINDETYLDKYPLYKNILTVSTTTSWDKDRFLVCLDDNYTYANNPDTFSWYGLRVMLPEDAIDLGTNGSPT
jgi:hypothetical protein